jgi:hypothetical protein
MAQQPHDKTGKKCHFYKKCKTVFTAQSMTLTISKKEKGLIVKHLVCAKCHNEFHELSE